MMMTMLMKAVLAGFVIVCVFPTHGVCFSRGASVSSCVTMKPGHISSFPQHTHTHSTVTARSVVEDRVVGGEFTLHPPSTHTLSCLSTDDTVTHSDKMLKRNLSFSWRAPTQPSGDLRFYITLVQSYFVYWSRIRSAVVHDGTRSSQITDSITGQPMSISTYNINTPTPDSTHETTANNTHTVPNSLLQTHTSIHTTTQQAHTYTHTVSLHPDPSPAPRRAPFDFFPSREPTEGAVSLTQRKKDPPKQAKDPSGVPKRGGERPERVPGQSASELGLLLGLSGALGMAIAVGLRYLQRKHCRKRTAVSLNDRNHDDRGIIHVQECGDLVQVRKIRQNSFLVLQAEYNLITPTGN
ncbi:Reelin domain-containing protein 1 [Labeo rohita]|uniref:Reelin domain-containing protein 1 n=1 Tax=Labeo rohita TaxID=84645 RepID=A0ABQ8LFC9_LABRO|nr:Reelin domain-containing protein 1 [Labeo rohita]